MQKTIFIIITRSFITRNILRSGPLDLLKKSGHKIIVFFSAKHIPDYLREEFENEQVKLFAFSGNAGRLLAKFTGIKDYLVDTGSTRMRLIFYSGARHFKSEDVLAIEKCGFKIFIRLCLMKIISRIGFLKPLMRWIEIYIFPEKEKIIQRYFDTYKPDLVFSTSIISRLDIAFMKEAKRRDIKTVSMPKSWDNITNGYYRFVPDYFLAPNELSKNILPDLQDMAENKIYIVGLPQFDWHYKKEIRRTRGEHFKRKGLDPNRALLFFGSEGAWAVNDYQIAEKIYEWVKNDELAKPCQLLVRPHYSNIKGDVFKNLRNKKNVVVDDYRAVDFLNDRWDPNIPETIDFVNSVVHCDIMINTGSTLILDAACVDKPIIGLSFGCEFRGGKDITTPILYTADHLRWVLSIGGTEKVDSFKELKEQINRYLLNPEIRAKGRKLLREKLCYKVDGLSSKRMVDAIDEILSV